MDTVDRKQEEKTVQERQSGLYRAKVALNAIVSISQVHGWSEKDCARVFWRNLGFLLPFYDTKAQVTCEENMYLFKAGSFLYHTQHLKTLRCLIFTYRILLAMLFFLYYPYPICSLFLILKWLFTQIKNSRQKNSNTGFTFNFREILDSQMSWFVHTKGKKYVTEIACLHIQFPY